MDAPNSSTPPGAALARTPLRARLQRALDYGKSVDTPRAMRVQKLVVFLSQAFIVLFITFVLAEVTLRIYNSINPLSIFYSTSYNRFRGKPFSFDYETFHLNSRGFKDVEHSIQKAAGTFRILGIGDSFAFGVVPYADNYLTLLNEELNRNGKHAELVNMGIPGTDPADYLSLFIHEGLELEPDMVVLSFFIGNDFEEQSRSLLSYSYAASAIKFLIDVNTKFEGRIIHGKATYHDDANTVTDAQYLNLERARSSIFLRNNKPFERDVTNSWSHVREMYQICARLGIRFLVVVIPDELQVNEQLQQKVIDASRLPPEAFDFALPNKMLIAKFRESDIDYIDLCDDFASMSKSMRLYKPNDSHWNIAGNRTASEMIAKHITAAWE